MTRVAAVVGTADFSGGSKVILGYLEALSGSSFQVDFVLCPLPATSLSESSLAAALSLGMPAEGCAAIQSRRQFGAALRFGRSLRLRGINLLVASNAQNAIRFAALAKLAHSRLRIVALANNEFGFRGLRFFHPLKVWAYRAAFLSAADRIVFVSKALRDRIAGSRRSILERALVIPNSVDTSRLTPNATRRARKRSELFESLGIPIESQLVLYSARLSRQKDIETFVRVGLASASLNGRVHFILAGEPQDDSDQDYADVVYSIARAGPCSGHVHFLGWRRDVPALLDACDLYLSTARWEGLPLGVVEAMSMAKPVVSTRFASAEEVVTHGKSGLLLPLGDVDGLTGAVLEVLSAPDLGAALGREGRRLALERFDVRAANSAFTKVLDETANA